LRFSHRGDLNIITGHPLRLQEFRNQMPRDKTNSWGQPSHMPQGIRKKLIKALPSLLLDNVFIPCGTLQLPNKQPTDKKGCPHAHVHHPTRRTSSRQKG
jgi:hypothetical protein